MHVFPKLVMIGAISCLFYSCKTKAQKETAPIVDETISGKFNPPTQQIFDSNAIAKFVDSFPNLRVVARELHAFYQGRNYMQKKVFLKSDPFTG